MLVVLGKVNIEQVALGLLLLLISALGLRRSLQMKQIDTTADFVAEPRFRPVTRFDHIFYVIVALCFGAVGVGAIIISLR